MDNEIKEINKLNLKHLLLIIFSILLVITVGTFAWLSLKTSESAIVLIVGDSRNIEITLKPYQLDLKISPILTYTSLDANEEYVTVTATNYSSKGQMFNLYYDIKEIDSSLTSNDFKFF